jgi:tetratricopeptide (TPR) repeat protein
VRIWRILAPVLLLASAAPAQRAKPAFDPETKEGLLIEHILQERDTGEKLRYMEEFAAQYPSHNAIAWVYDQLQPAYFEAKEYDQAIRIGSLRLAIEPDNLDAAAIALRAADAKKDAQQIIKWADRLWTIAAAAAQKPSADASEAKQSQDYAESCLYQAMKSADSQTQLSILKGLEQRDPQSRFVHSFPAEYFRIYQALGNEDQAVEMAEKGLKIDPDNMDMLLAVTRFHSRKDTPRERELVVEYSQRLIGAVEKTSRPAAMGEQEWAQKKAETLGVASYLGGMASALNKNYRQADHMLREALPYLKDNDSELAALLYYLGMANYRLAESGSDRSRPVDAVRFLRRCAAIHSPYQEQASRNLEGIRAEYSLP